MLQLNEKSQDKFEENENLLDKVFSSFTRSQQKLLNVYEDTFKLIDAEPYLKSRDTGFLKEESICNILENSVSIFVFGDSYQKQCQFLNHFLGANILPTHSPSWLSKRSPITVRYGAKIQLNFTLPSSFILPVTQTYALDNELNSSLLQYAELCQNINTTSDKYFMEINVKELENSGLEILLNKPFLKENVNIIIKDFDMMSNQTSTELNPNTSTFQHSSQHIPILIYAIDLKDININKLKQLKTMYTNLPVLFWLPEQNTKVKKKFIKSSLAVLNTVTTLPYFNTLKSENIIPQTQKIDENLYQNINQENIKKILKQDPLNCVTNQSTVKLQTGKNTFKKSILTIHEVKSTLQYIGFNFGNICAVDNQLKNHCCVLYEDNDNEFIEIVDFMETTLKSYLFKPANVIKCFHHEVLDEMINRVFTLSRDVMMTPKKMEYARNKEAMLYKRLMEIATHEQDEITNVIGLVKQECGPTILDVAKNYPTSVDDSNIISFHDVTILTNNIQDMVVQQIKLASANRLSKNIDVLRENMTGTLQRCLESLESSTDSQGNTDDDASTHLKLIINAAYNVEVNIKSSSSLLKIVMDKIIGLLHQLLWKEVPILDENWKLKIAKDVLINICEEKLAKNICSQFRLHLHNSHKAFLCAMRHLEAHHTERVKREKEDNHRTAKVLAPHIAQLTLRSKSFIDELIYGIPKLGREIGRGMYGVVYACSDWPTSTSSGLPCAVKSVVPFDEKHWKDLALEFYYSSCLPPHPRIVQLHGSIVDDTYSEDQSAVLLIMERLNRDLHTALKRGMYEHHRMIIALDVVEGIRFLHSQGLVHRDIKLKNILLDENNRAKISDLGFCKPSAMISGSIVGTPVHMPPELFTGKYDSSVDVYAFGILFWHLCSGSIKLPKNYKKCSTKDHLWNAVRNGTRPECLSMFRNDCWLMMSQCWDANPSHRPLLGNIEEKLRHIIELVVKENGLCA